MHVYRWLKPLYAREGSSDANLRRLPSVHTKKKWTKKTKPGKLLSTFCHTFAKQVAGLATFHEEPRLVGPEHLKELFLHAQDIIPDDEAERTPVFLLATAGMRLLDKFEKNSLLDAVCEYIQSSTHYLLPDCDVHVQVIPGATEGLYGWIAANYLLEGFDSPAEHQHGKSHHTYGFLDMGGASAQIAFAPNSTETEKHSDDLQLLRLRTLDGLATEYKVFTTTWLGFGVNEARRRYVEELVESVVLHDEQEMPDPCLPVNLQTSQIVYDNTTVNLVGTGLFSECLSRTLPLLHKDVSCSDPPCLFDGIHVPAIDFDVNHFVGVSEYWHTTHEIFEMGYTDKTYDFQTYRERVTKFCEQEWATILDDVEDHKWGHKVDDQRAAEVCFKASWIINVLHNGIGIPRHGIETDGSDKGNETEKILDHAKQEGYLAPFQAINKIDSTEVSWTLGKIVLYASSLIPPAYEGVKAVGFGSNIPSALLPSDFQHAGGSPDYTIVETESDTVSPITLTDEVTDDLASGTNHYRAAQAIFGVLVFLLVILYLAGHERRAIFHRKILSSFSRGRQRSSRSLSSPSRWKTPRLGHALTSKLPFGLGGNAQTRYERLIEEGFADSQSQQNYSDIELDGVHANSMSGSGDDSGSGSSLGNRSQSARSRNGYATPGYDDSSTQRANASNNILQQGVGLGLTMDGESMGNRSYGVSPSRFRSPGLGRNRD